MMPRGYTPMITFIIVTLAERANRSSDATSLTLLQPLRSYDPCTHRRIGIGERKALWPYAKTLRRNIRAHIEIILSFC